MSGENYIPLVDTASNNDRPVVDGNYWANRLMDLQDQAVDPDKWPKVLEATLSQLLGKQCNALLKL